MINNSTDPDIEQLRRAFIAAQLKFDAAAALYNRELAARKAAEAACETALENLTEAYKATSESGRALIRAKSNPDPIVTSETALYLRVGTMLDTADIIRAVAPGPEMLPDPAAN